MLKKGGYSHEIALVSVSLSVLSLEPCFVGFKLANTLPEQQSAANRYGVELYDVGFCF